MKLIALGLVVIAMIVLITGCGTGNAVAAEKPAAEASPRTDAPAMSAEEKPAPPPHVSPAPSPNLPTWWIIGDSTVRNGSKEKLGWGEVIASLFDETKINIANKAIAGRSTRNYIAQGRWAEVLKLAKPGDYVSVQFGHNDGGNIGGPKGDRGVLKGIGEETKDYIDDANRTVTVHTYGWYLRQYVREAKAKKLNVILVTPVCRDNWNKDGTLNNGIRVYCDWMIEVAKQENAMLLDLNAVIVKHYSEMGPSKVSGIFFTGTDHTHTTPVGAHFNAACVAEGLRAMKDCGLKDYLKK